MIQIPLHKSLTHMLKSDTGTNVHKIYVECPLSDILKSWNISKRDMKGKVKGRKLKVTEISSGYSIELHRPEKENKSILI